MLRITVWLTSLVTLCCSFHSSTSWGDTTRSKSTSRKTKVQARLASPPTTSAPHSKTNKQARLLKSASGLKAAKPFQFKWPIPGSVTVVEHVLKKGRKATLRYNIVTQPLKKGRIKVAIKNLTFLSLQGIDFNTKVGRMVRKRVERYAKIIPAFIVDHKGNYLDVTGIRKILLALLQENGTTKLSPKKQAQFKKMLLSKPLINTLKSKSSELWLLWVGYWVGLKLQPGQRTKVTMENAIMNQKYKAHATIRHQGMDKQQRVKLKLHMDMGTKALRKAFRAMVKVMGMKKRMANLDIFKAMRSIMNIEIVTDPSTLRPVKIKKVQKTHLTMKDGTSAKQVEQHTYYFQWKPSATKSKK